MGGCRTCILERVLAEIRAVRRRDEGRGIAADVHAEIDEARGLAIDDLQGVARLDARHAVGRKGLDDVDLVRQEGSQPGAVVGQEAQGWGGDGHPLDENGRRGDEGVKRQSHSTLL